MTSMIHLGEVGSIKKLKFGRQPVADAFPHHLIVENLRMGRTAAESRVSIDRLTTWITTLLGPHQNWYNEDVPETVRWAADGHSGYCFRTEADRKLIIDRLIIIGDRHLPMLPERSEARKARHAQTQLDLYEWVGERIAAGQKVDWVKHMLMVDDPVLAIEAAVRWR